MSDQPQLSLLSDDDVVEVAKVARETADAIESEASPSRWVEADSYAELAGRGWTQQRIAERSEVSQQTVSVYVRVSTRYLVKQSRPGFWTAYATVTGEKAPRVPRELPPPPALPAGAFPVVYCDPPWRYEHASTPSRAVENQYPTLALDQIKALDVPAAPAAVLFMWATSPKLEEAIQVVNAWDFTYRTCMVWVKDKIGMGYYVRQQHELVLIARRGDMPLPDETSLPPSVIHAPRGRHSEKPSEFYKIIEQLYPGYPKVELFARSSREGWEAWGNEIAVAA
jgi:N6-adenosine-specific RNA methylase IME4